MATNLALVDTGARKLRFAAGRGSIGPHDAAWAEPYPMWPGVPARLGGPAAGHFRPLLLSYRRDDFMDRVQAQLQQAGTLPEASPQAGRTSVKLFQPFHGEYALVGASLVCGVPGHPDREVHAEKQERVWFVIRRVRTLATGTTIEEAWTAGEKSGWVRAGTPVAPLPVEDEEKLPLVRLQALNGRRVFIGYIPVASRDTYQATSSDPLTTVADAQQAFAEIAARLATIQQQHGRLVSAQLLLSVDELLRLRLPQAHQLLRGADTGTPTVQDRALVTWLEAAGNFQPLAGTWASALGAVRAQKTALGSATLDPGPVPQYDLTRIPPARLTALATRAESAAGAGGNAALEALVRAEFDAIRRAHDTLREDRWKASLEWLQSFTGDYWAAPAASEAPASDAVANVGWLGSYMPEVALAIRAAPGARAAGETPGVSSAGPAAELWAGLEALALLDPLIAAAPRKPPSQQAITAAESTYDVTAVNAAGFAALWSTAEAAMAGAVLPKYPVDADEEEVHFVVRCVLEHACRTPVKVVFSHASAPWVPAGVFDSEAPARQLRVPLPVDLDPAKLARPMGLGFMLSKELRKQMGRANQNILSTFKASSPSGIDVGAICTFSIPIVTICALILLLIMVNILNIIFRWLPYFVVCLPLNLSGKPKPPPS